MPLSRTAKALQALEQRENRPWREIIREYAEAGYAWRDVAEIVGVKADALKAWCHTRRLSFPWQGVASPIQRAHQSRMNKGPRSTIYKNHTTYTAFGVTTTLPRLAKQFGHLHNITYETLLRRVNAGMNPETALTTPLMSPSEKYQRAMERKAALKHQRSPRSVYAHEPPRPDLGL